MLGWRKQPKLVVRSIGWNYGTSTFVLNQKLVPSWVIGVFVRKFVATQRRNANGALIGP